MFSLRPHQQDAFDTMRLYDKGQLIMPTGSGKTLCMIFDAMREYRLDTQTIVVVAPRILLSQQLSSEFLEVFGLYPEIQPIKVLHVHSGETEHYSTTDSTRISVWSAKNCAFNQIIFTTYHSLHRVMESEIHVDTIYFDEAHNSVQRNFIDATEHFSLVDNIRCYYFTATPKHSSVSHRIGMDDDIVYGDVIYQLPAPDLVDSGYILPPQVVVKQLPPNHGSIPDRDCDHLYTSIVEEDTNKVLVAASRTSHIIDLVEQTDFAEIMKELGYSLMYITSKTGAYIDGNKVDRDTFFETLSDWGRDDDKKFIVIHHSILSEGINVSGLESVIFMRNMDYITFSQTIGRVIRLHHNDAKNIRDGKLTAGDIRSYQKPFGLLVVPVHSQVGINTARRLQKVVDTIFVDGQPAISVMKN